MTETKEKARASAELYEQDFHLWVEEQARLLKERRFSRLDLPNLIDEIEDMARSQKRAIRNDLTVLLTHLLKYQFQPDRRSTSWTGSIVEHRRRILEEIEDSPSLRGYPAQVFERCYRNAREQAAAETGLAKETFPPTSPYSPQQALQPGYLPE